MEGAEEAITNESRSSDHSAGLAEKLLQGWALIQEHCPQCLTPLVRDRQRKMYCVACAQWVISQTEAAELLARERVEKGGGEGTSEPIPHPLPLPEPASADLISSHPNSNVIAEEEQNMNPVEPNNTVRAAQNLACTQDRPRSSNTGGAYSTLIIPKLEYRSKALQQVLPNIYFILIHKLEEIGNALLSSQDVNEMRMLMSALRECLQTIEGLKHREEA